MSVKYRPEIDGLRAIAVCAVLAYHARLALGDVALFKGGFLGVDVFFVISGYLITRIILGDLASERGFSFARFYERRARRILPALAVVMIVSTGPAWAILMPGEFERYAASLVASLLFYANHFWHLELTAYGAQSSLLEPFVHTWSLAVEEQFYFLLPVALVLLWRLAPRLILPALVLGVVVGLPAAELASRRFPELSFFWLPSRAWELLAGGVLAWAAEKRPGALRGLPGTRHLPSLGLLAIAVSIIVVDLDAHVHPGFATVPAVLGVCLVIWFADPRDPATRLLSSRAFVGVGLISYSLYLWHYPVFAFGRHLSPVPALWEKGAWIALSLALAVLSWRLVEQPFRDRARVPLPAVAGGAAATAVAVLAFFAVVQANDGFADRFPRLQAIYGGDGFDNEALRERSWEPLRAISGPDPADEPHAHAPSRAEAQVPWFDDDPATENVLVVGNSHSKDVFNALHLNRERLPGFDFARFGMFMKLPQDQRARFFASPNFAAADTVLLAFRWPEALEPSFDAFVRRIEAEGKRVLLAGNTAEFLDVGHLPLFDWKARFGGDGFSAEAVNRLAWERRDPRADAANDEVRAAAERLGLPFLDLVAVLCDADAGRCEIAGPAGEKLLYDYGHWTLDGARRFGQAMAEHGWLPPRDASGDGRS